MKLYTFYKVNIHKNKGYAWANWLMSVQYWLGNYLIVLNIPLLDLKWTIYKSKVKPTFRHLGLLTILLFPCAVFWSVLYITTIPFVFFTHYFCAIFLHIINIPQDFDFRDKASAVIWFFLGVYGLFCLFL